MGRAITVGEASFGSSRFVFWVWFGSVRFGSVPTQWRSLVLLVSFQFIILVQVRFLFSVFVLQVSSFISLTKDSEGK